MLTPQCNWCHCKIAWHRISQTHLKMVFRKPLYNAATQVTTSTKFLIVYACTVVWAGMTAALLTGGNICVAGTWSQILLTAGCRVRRSVTTIACRCSPSASTTVIIGLAGIRAIVGGTCHCHTHSLKLFGDLLGDLAVSRLALHRRADHPRQSGSQISSQSEIS